MGYLAVVERHREGGEDTSALDGQAGSRSQGVADHAGVVQRQVGWLLEEEIIVPDAAAAGEAVGPGGDGVVVPDQVVPQQQVPLVQYAAAEDARRAMGAARRDPIAADDAVRDARRAAVVDRSPRGLGFAVLARHQRGVARDPHVAHGLQPVVAP